MTRNYFLYHLFHDRRFWIKFLIPAVLTLVLLDILSYMFAPPGFFNLWTVYLSGPTLLLGLVLRTIRDETRKQARVKLQNRQTSYERQRLAEIRERLEREPDFLTLCHTCRFFNQESRSCAKTILNPKAREVSVASGKTVCLHWLESI